MVASPGSSSMSLYKRGDIWWYEFVFAGERFRESTKQSNKRIAEQMEAARRTQLAKGEVGIKDRIVSPSLGAFAELEFLPFVEQQKRTKPNTLTFYRSMVRNLKANTSLWKKPIDTIEVSDLTVHVGRRQAAGMETTSINRELATIRRMLKLALEWNRVTKTLPKVRLLSGENRRERVISREEERAYLEVATPLLRDFAILMLDCGLRPEEIHRLTAAQFRAGAVEIHKGKTAHARRSVPASPRVKLTLEARKAATENGWIFPAATATGHIDSSSLKKHHAGALKAAQLKPFVLYSLRHTCLTRWAEAGMDTFVLKRLAGHANISTTLRYIHMSDAHTRAEMERILKVQGTHNSPPTSTAIAGDNQSTSS
jgi:integrase